jgi:hypothetical protein
MRIEVSNRWEENDKNVLFNMPFVDDREAVDFFGKYGGNYAADKDGALYFKNGSLTDNAPTAWLSGYNVVDNKTKKEMDFVINGKAASSKTLEVDGVRCRDGTSSWCTTAPVIVECTGEQKLWSAAASWAVKEGEASSVPKAGESAVVPSGVIMIFDLAESPILELLTINGCLQFLSDNSKDQHLRAHQIYVQGGKFEIGKSNVPYTRTAKITLYGEETADTITMDGATEAGNKLIANNGEVKFYGSSRSREARLFEPAAKGATTVKVNTGLDWKTDDEIAFAPTALQHLHLDLAVVKSYNSSTGALELKSALKYYHFGAATSTGANYKGVDMRGEVILLTRNIKIIGDKTENDYGGQFITADATQLSATGEEKILSGLVILKNVEFKHMGQKNTFRAGLRIQNSKRKADIENSHIENVVIHQGMSFGINMDNVENVTLKNCDVVDVYQIGVNVASATNVKLDSVNVYGTKKRSWLTLVDNVSDKECCVAFCSFDPSKCTKSSIINSRVAGCPFSGFIVPGYGCADKVGESSTNVFKDNIAHSVDGTGATIYQDPAVSSSETCYQGSHFTAYKIIQAGIATMFSPMEIRMSNMVMIDNQLGVSIQGAGETDNERKLVFKDSFVYGESTDLPSDCPDGTTGKTGANCYCPDKYGLMSFGSNRKGKDLHITIA